MVTGVIHFSYCYHYIVLGKNMINKGKKDEIIKKFYFKIIYAEN